MDSQETRKILRKYREGNCSAKEKLLIESWYAQKQQEKSAITETSDLKELGRNIWKAIVAEIRNRRISLRNAGNTRFRI
jgi:transmembrane sensor